nr:hypothetical protein MtrDRAFT_AC157472g2v2 [Medicago truncatula]
MGWGVSSATGRLSLQFTCSFLVLPSSRCGIRCLDGWLGWEFVMPLGLAQQFQAFTGLGGGRKVRLCLLLVWHAVIWTIWASRNDLIFAGGLLREEPVVDRVKILA